MTMRSIASEWGLPPLREGRLGGDPAVQAQLLFHLALRCGAAAGSQEADSGVAEIARVGSSHAVDAALAMAGSDLAAHPDDEVLRRAVLVLDQSKRRLTR